MAKIPNKIQHTSDQEAIDLFDKRVRMVNKKTGNVTYNFVSPEYGLKRTKAGGKWYIA